MTTKEKNDIDKSIPRPYLCPEEGVVEAITKPNYLEFLFYDPEKTKSPFLDLTWTIIWKEASTRGKHDMDLDNFCEDIIKEIAKHGYTFLPEIIKHTSSCTKKNVGTGGALKLLKPPIK